MSDPILCGCVDGPQDGHTFMTEYPGAYVEFYGDDRGRYVLEGGNDEMRVYRWREVESE